MKQTDYVIRYGAPDSQGHTFTYGSFGQIDAKRVPVTIGFNPSNFVGFAILRETAEGVTAEFDIPELNSLVPAASFTFTLIGTESWTGPVKDACFISVGLVSPEARVISPHL